VLSLLQLCTCTFMKGIEHTSRKRIR
jgi:hypothetical protein